MRVKKKIKYEINSFNDGVMTTNLTEHDYYVPVYTGTRISCSNYFKMVLQINHTRVLEKLHTHTVTLNVSLNSFGNL